MAIGDIADAAGMDLVAETDDKRKGAEEINKTRDYIATEMTARAAADALKFDAAKIKIQTTTPAVVTGGIWFKPV